MTESTAPRQGSSHKPPEQLRELLVKLPSVTIGTRFGGEAFFFRKRFFCHFHPTRNLVFLETFVWNKVEDIVREVPGTIPHPEYEGYGWVRLPLDSEDAVSRGRHLIETTYRYLRTIKRVSVPKEEFQPRVLELIKTKLPGIRIKVREAKKRNQIILETPGLSDYEQADHILDEAARILRSSSHNR